MHDLHLLLHVAEQGGWEKVPAAGLALAAHHQRCALAERPRHFIFHSLNRLGADQRPHIQPGLLVRVAKGDLTESLGQPGNKLRINLPLYVNAFGAVTHLPTVDDA
ncbi:hypothetical protein D3C75_1006320 [compost metagenome]